MRLVLLMLLALPASARNFSGHAEATRDRARLATALKLQAIYFAPSGRHVLVNDALLRQGDPLRVAGLPKYVTVKRIGRGSVAFAYDGFFFHRRLPRGRDVEKLLPPLTERARLKVKRLLYTLGFSEPKKRLRMLLEDTFGWSRLGATKFAVREAPRL